MQKAVTFLVDALKTFEAEGWSLLTAQTLMDTAKCYEALGESEKLVRTCAQISCTTDFVSEDQRDLYFDKIAATLQATSGKS